MKKMKKMKKICAVLMTFALAIVLGATAWAGFWGVKKKEPKTTTSGDYEYSVNADGKTVTLEKYTGKDEVIEVPSEMDGLLVTEIGYQAFTYRTIKSISFPDSVCSLGERSFEYCDISELQLPENVTVMEDAFSYAKLPPVLMIPAGGVVEECAFSYCDTIKNVFIGSNAEIKSRAFEYCRDLTHVVAAAGSRLEWGAFGECGDLETVILCGEVELEEAPDSDSGYKGVKRETEGEFDTLLRSALENPLRNATPYDAFAEEKELEILDSPAFQDGVIVSLDHATAKVNDRGGFEYTFGGTLMNGADEGIMQVIYTFSLRDANGEEYRSFSEIYDGEDTALEPHGIVEFFHDNIKWGKQSIPAAVSIGISSVQTESELPPAYIPKEGNALYLELGDEKLAGIREEPPVMLQFHIDQGGYGRTATFEAGEALDEAVELFCDIRIGEESGEWVTDNYNWIRLVWADGSSTYISLNLYNLEYFVHSSPRTYGLENLGAFWSYASTYLQEDS